MGRRAGVRGLGLLLAGWHYATFLDGNRLLATDIRFYVYFAGRVVAGEVPYRDFFEIKAPLAVFAGALLHSIGVALDSDPLLAIRAGYLGLAALTAVLLFEIQWRLTRDLGAAFLALSVQLGFGLLGLLPSVGNIPKMLVAFFATLAVLFAHHRRWVPAGICGALAALDWQIGALALLAVAIAALVDSADRGRQVGYVLVGAAGALVPFAGYFLAQGALGAALGQTVGAAFGRGSATLAQRSAVEQLQRLLSLLVKGCEGHLWLVALSLAGLVVFPLWMRRLRARGVVRLPCALAVYHYGLVVYCAIDFQGYGDLFILLHSLSFFSGVAAIELYRWALVGSRRLPVWSGGPRRQRATAWILLLILVIATRPALLREELSLPLPPYRRGVTLEDQLEVSEVVRPLMRDRRLAFVEATELLILTGRVNDLPFVAWDDGNHRYYRTDPSEGFVEAWHRMLRGSVPDVVVPSRLAPFDPELAPLFTEHVVSSTSGRYSVRLFLRQGVLE